MRLMNYVQHCLVRMSIKCPQIDMLFPQPVVCKFYKSKTLIFFLLFLLDAMYANFLRNNFNM